MVLSLIDYKTPLIVGLARKAEELRIKAAHETNDHSAQEIEFLQQLLVLSDALEDAGFDCLMDLQHLRNQCMCYTCGGLGVKNNSEIVECCTMCDHTVKMFDAQRNIYVERGCGYVATSFSHRTGCYILDSLLGWRSLHGGY